MNKMKYIFMLVALCLIGCRSKIDKSQLRKENTILYEDALLELETEHAYYYKLEGYGGLSCVKKTHQ